MSLDPPKPLSPSPSLLIRLRNVSRRYRIGESVVRALDGIDMDVNEGEFVAVVGRSGSGKSTLLHLLAAMDVPTAGSIHVGPWDLVGMTRRDRAAYRRSEIGMVFQQFNLIPSMDAVDNVALPLLLSGTSRPERLDRAVAGLERVGLQHRLHHRPLELSGGEQQRVAIARALVHEPPLILADEPTGNLDSGTARDIIGLLSRIHREDGKTILLVTHDAEESGPVADRRIDLDDGRIVRDELLTDSTAG